MLFGNEATTCSYHLQLRKERPGKPVESRKFTKVYLEFLKDSQRFYRDHIQKLNARFGGISELERVARQVKSDCTFGLHVPPLFVRY